MRQSVVEQCFLRSLGSQVSFTRVPPLPKVHTQLLESAVRPDIAIRDHVILGFLPGFPNILVTIRNPRRLGIAHVDGYMESTMVNTACLLAIDPGRHVIVSAWSSWSMPSAYYKNLTKSFTAVSGPQNRLVQVLCFCLDREEGSGTVMCRTIQSLPPRSQQDRSEEWDAPTTESTCSTTELGMADVCFSRVERYVVVLLRTRCIFFLQDSVGPLTARPRSKNPCWTDETGDAAQTGGAVLVFELDIFVEQLLTKQGHVLGHGDASGWHYYAVFDPRPRSQVRDMILSVSARRGHNLSAERGSVFLLGVLGDDARSVLVLTLFLDPLALGAEDGDADQKDFLVFDAKRWHLAEEAPTEEATQVLQRAIEQIHKSAARHDCSTTCDHGAGGTTVLATYESEGTASVKEIEGSYWTISGTDWDDKLR